MGRRRMREVGPEVRGCCRACGKTLAGELKAESGLCAGCTATYIPLSSPDPFAFEIFPLNEFNFDPSDLLPIDEVQLDPDNGK